MKDFYYKNKNTLIASAIVILSLFIYYGYFTGETTPPVTETGVPEQVQISALEKLKSLQNIDDRIFSDPLYVSLKDRSPQLSPEPVGRSNPFAPTR